MDGGGNGLHLAHACPDGDALLVRRKIPVHVGSHRLHGERHRRGPAQGLHESLVVLDIPGQRGCQLRQGLAIRLAHIEHLHRAEHGNLNFPFLHDDLALCIQHGGFGVRVQFLFLDLFLERRGRDDGDTVFTALHMALKLVFPLVVPGHQRGVRLLHIDEHGVVDGVAVEPGHHGQVAHILFALEQLFNALFDARRDLLQSFPVGGFVSHEVHSPFYGRKFSGVFCDPLVLFLGTAVEKGVQQIAHVVFFLDGLQKARVRVLVRRLGGIVGLPFSEQVIVARQDAPAVFALFFPHLCLGFLPNIASPRRGLAVIGKAKILGQLFGGLLGGQVVEPGGLSHELYLTNYVNKDGGYYWGNKAENAWGQHEKQDLPTENLRVEKSERFTFGVDFKALRNRLAASVDVYTEKRSQILANANALYSSVIGVSAGYQNIGINKYKGLDASLSWSDKINKFEYGVKLNLSYMKSEVVKDNRGFQEYDYLYHNGDLVGQYYGLEAIGFFKDQQEIDESPQQTFSTVQPGDVKYKDQNDDKIIDDRDIVKVAGAYEVPFYYGFNLRMAYKGIELNADFQGATGRTVSLLDSPLYKPLANNGNISSTFLDREIPWTAENKENATMPRLSTQTSVNNYKGSSLWYKEVAFLKLRNLRLAYTLPKSWTKKMNLKVYVEGTNLFSVDNLKFTDPEQLEATYPALRSYWGGLTINF